MEDQAGTSCARCFSSEDKKTGRSLCFREGNFQAMFLARCYLCSCWAWNLCLRWQCPRVTSEGHPLDLKMYIKCLLSKGLFILSRTPKGSRHWAQC